MARMKIKLDHPGVAAVLTSGEVASAIADLTETVASNAEGWETNSGEPIPVVTSTYTTDRAAGAVTLAHAAGGPLQAKYGVLTEAAARAGLEVRTR
jgi:hypothetical protein